MIKIRFAIVASCLGLTGAGCGLHLDLDISGNQVDALANEGVLVQSITTTGAEDFAAFSINGTHYLAVANSYDGTSGSQSSYIYRWNGPDAKYQLFQTLDTEYALDWEHFRIDTDHYLAVANLRTTSPWSNNIDSEIYKWDGYEFVPFQSVATHGASDWEHARIAGEHYLVVANSTDDASFDIDSQVLRFDSAANAFVHHQWIPTRHAHDSEVFVIGNSTYLAVANTKGGDYHSQTKAVDSAIYWWDPYRQAFAQIQTIQTEGALDWEHWEIDGRHFLGVANSGNDSTGHVDSIVYEWNGLERYSARFNEYQRIPTFNASDIEPLQDGTKSRLVVGNYFKNGTRNTDSYIYEWEGQSFVQPTALPTHGVRGFETMVIDGVHYLAIANQHDDTSYVANSEVRQIGHDDGVFIEEYQGLVPHGATDWEYVETADEHSRAGAHPHDDAKRNTDSRIFRAHF